MNGPDARPWSQAELGDPHRVPDKAERVQAMFDAIAPSYDLNNRVHSAGRDQAWRRRLVRAAEVSPGETVLDVACGTGDLALAFTGTPAARVLGMDFAAGMLDRARAKGAGPAGPCYQAADAMRLPLADGSVDVVSIAFGIRNVVDPAAALAEFYRVLAPGGRLLILEFGRPRVPLFRAIYHVYFHHVMPRTASWLARDRTEAYRYLPRSVDTFIDRDRLVAMMEAAGFEAVASERLTLGICMLYRGRREGRADG